MDGKTEKNSEHYYVHPEDVSESEVIFRKEESRHLIRVLRKKTGDIVFAMDGKGNRYEVRLAKKNGELLTAEILSRQQLVNESNLELTLAQGIIKSSRMDWLVEKAVELGVKRIVPVCTKNSSIRTISTNRLERMRHLALSAMKQSGQFLLPEIDSVRTLDQLFETSNHYGLKLIAHPDREEEAIPSNPSAPLRILCLVGPEGGFDETEVKKAMGFGFHPVSLGPSRLRSETAGIALLVAAQIRFGGWRGSSAAMDIM